MTTIENIVAKLTRSHVGPNAKESFQCLVCSKWFAVPPIKHMRGHIINAREEKRKSLPLMEGKFRIFGWFVGIYEILKFSIMLPFL